MILDSDDTIVSQLRKQVVFRSNIQKQVEEQTYVLGGNHTIDIGALLSVYYVVMVDEMNTTTNKIELVPHTYFFTTRIDPNTCIRLNYDDPVIRKYYCDNINKIQGYKDLVRGPAVMEEILNSVYERFEDIVKHYNIDIDRLFVLEHAPLKTT